jgi:hypothetical protein
MLKVNGTLAMPRKSLNGNFYFASELAKGHNKVVSLRLNHDKTEMGVIGESLLIWDAEKEHLNYEATITSAMVETQVSELISSGEEVKVSLGLSANEEATLCHPDGGDCMSTPIDVSFNEMSILLGESPGIPEVSLSLSESKCGKHSVELFSTKCNIVSTEGVITSINTETLDNKVMTSEKNEQELNAEFDAKVDAAVSARLDAHLKKAEVDAAEKSVAAKEAEDCAADDLKCKADQKAKDEAAELESKTSLENSIKDMVEKRVAEETAKIQTELVKTEAKKSEVSESVSPKQWEEAQVDEQVTLLEKVLSGEQVSIKIDKEEFLEKHSVFKPSQFSEAVSTSGTIPGVDVGQQIVILPGGILVKTIRPWVQVKVIPQGHDTVRFYTLDIPAFGTITEHVSTDITPATSTLTATEVSANTVRGFRQNVLKAEVEKYPKDLLEKIRETARTRAFEDEVTIVLSTIAASTSVDFGANHLGATTGAAVADNAAEDALGVMKAAGIEAAKVRLQSQGHDPENGSAVIAMTPKAQKELIQDTVIVNFIQNSSPEISRQGRINLYFGIEIFVTNSIKTDLNNAARNICFMKGKAFGLAVGRDIELEFGKNIVRQSVDIVATHRVNAVVLDATAYVILSSKND